VDEMLAGDYSMENQQEAAEHFMVSELTIRTLLVNHRRLEREKLEGSSNRLLPEFVKRRPVS
jgi:hypothetical protein